MSNLSFKHKVIGIFSDRYQVDLLLNELNNKGYKHDKISVLAKQLHNESKIQTHSTATYPEAVTENALYYSNTEGYKFPFQPNKEVTGNNDFLDAENQSEPQNDFLPEGESPQPDNLTRKHAEYENLHRKVGTRFSVYDEVETKYSDTYDVKEENPHSLARGATTGGLVGLLAGLGVLLVPGIGTVLAAGPLAAAIAAGAGGAALGATAGTVVGLLRDEGIPHSRAGYYKNCFDKGSVIVVAHTNNENEISEFKSLLNKYNPDTLDVF